MGLLARGDRAATVRELQGALMKVGALSLKEYQTGPGVFGPKTQAAVRSFQEKSGCKVDGIYGPETRAALQRALRTPDRVPDIPRETPRRESNRTRSEVAPPPAQAGKVAKPPVVWMESPNQNSRRGSRVDTIVIHHTASNSGKQDLETLRNPRAKVSAHYLVDKDGTIYQLVHDNRRAWHAGKSELHGVPTDVNSRSIGIEIVNRGDGKTPFTEAQYQALEQLVPYLAKTHGVPLENLVGHKEIAVPRGRKSDPAPNFDFGRLRRATARVE